MLIGGTYGRNPGKNKHAKNYNSITKTEYLAAREANIPTYAFVKTDAYNDYETWIKNPKEKRNSISYAHVDNKNVFRLIETIAQHRPNNPVLRFSSHLDLLSQLKAQIAGIHRSSLKEMRKRADFNKPVPINSFKLFYYRTERKLSLTRLSKEANINRYKLKNLERIRNSEVKFDVGIFPLCSKGDIQAIENVLKCANTLMVGRSDDFLSAYMQFYFTYKFSKLGKKFRRIFEQPKNHQIDLFNTKAVVFDFDGTLSKNEDDMTIWESLWVYLGYDLNECANYHRLFSEKKISHKRWCEITLEKFRERKLDESGLKFVTRKISPLVGTKEVLKTLRENGLKLYLLSGSIKQVIEIVLGEEYNLFHDVQANELIFFEGKLQSIRGTQYDFEGKPNYIKKIIQENGFSPLEVLFVGNSCNDIWASQSGAKTLCINPRFTDPNIVEHWSYLIRRTGNLKEILRYINMPNGKSCDLQ